MPPRSGRIVTAALFSTLINVAAAQNLVDPPCSIPPRASSNFQEVLIQAQEYPFGLGAGDLNNDGRQDLVVADARVHTIDWFEFSTTGTPIRHRVAEDLTSWFERLAIADIDGDGALDIAVVVNNKPGAVVWFKNPFPDDRHWDKFIVSVEGNLRPYNIAVADVDGDGLPDIAVSYFAVEPAIGKHTGAVWFKNPGKGRPQWERHVIDAGYLDARTIELADVNGDGLIDVVLTSRQTTPNIVWFANTGSSIGVGDRGSVSDERYDYNARRRLLPLDRRWAGQYVIGASTSQVLHAKTFAFENSKHTHVLVAEGNEVVWYENPCRHLPCAIEALRTTMPDRWPRHRVGDLDGAFDVVAGHFSGENRIDFVATSPAPVGVVRLFERSGDVWSHKNLIEGFSGAHPVVAADLFSSGVPRPLDLVVGADDNCHEIRVWRRSDPIRR